MDGLAQFIAPLVALWTIHSAILKSAGFVNKMRETVISGVYKGSKITYNHQKAILTDWILSVGATVIVCILFAGILISDSLEAFSSKTLIWAGFGIAVYPIICAILFTICSISDLKLMRQALTTAKVTEASNSN